jgi:rare lipoprotein A
MFRNRCVAAHTPGRFRDCAAKWNESVFSGICHPSIPGDNGMIVHSIGVSVVAVAALSLAPGTAMADAARTQTGIASVYSYHGSKTASGERTNIHGLTAAHRTLPFGTRVKVTNRRNGKSVVVRINDRGPFIKGRIIDVTPRAAQALAFSGLAPVSVTVLN